MKRYSGETKLAAFFLPLFAGAFLAGAAFFPRTAGFLAAGRSSGSESKASRAIESSDPASEPALPCATLMLCNGDWTSQAYPRFRDCPCIPHLDVLSFVLLSGFRDLNSVSQENNGRHLDGTYQLVNFILVNIFLATDLYTFHQFLEVSGHMTVGSTSEC